MRSPVAQRRVLRGDGVATRTCDMPKVLTEVSTYSFHTMLLVMKETHLWTRSIEERQKSGPFRVSLTPSRRHGKLLSILLDPVLLGQSILLAWGKGARRIRLYRLLTLAAGIGCSDNAVNSENLEETYQIGRLASHSFR